MKELSIEEKAKRYDKAIKVAENIHKFSSDPAEIKRMEEIFPEFKESEDERIRKEIIKYFKKYQALSLGDYNVQDILAWLEKQGKQKSTDDYNLTDIENSILNFAMQFHDNRMKPEAEWEDELKMLRDNIKIDPWSEEDEVKINRIVACLENLNVADNDILLKDVDWLKSLKDRVQPQPQQEWSEKYIANVFEKVGLAKIAREQGYDALTEAIQSAMIELSKFTPQLKQEWGEEDKDFMYDTLSNLTELKDRYGEGYGNVGKCIAWLKSLRPQSTWKPSVEQMIAIDVAINVLGKGTLNGKQLIGLQEQLKKLK